ncbi:putative dehydrogenase [Caldalkalibacillus uzonensis]|uniref:Dehydrogenase n=1 Tax=Caldalkalibacillus uzonensis TaxID=353224 RepID=A0ABU0CRS2_9BACI|nr:Gfo/Idh/MocA family oxidoreductase [Caldalkalibacillus uzonensis]MDQ0338566.1 putative dehydrogenase [Caldalkalibacillus uzonensis]
MSGEIRIGIVGLDTSHVVAFTQLLNDSDHEYHIPGGRVTMAYPGGSPDFELSISRVEGYKKTLQQDYGVQIVDSITEVAKHTDAILLESVDGRVHLEQFRQLAPFQKPVFIDKPLATTYKEACEICEMASQYNVPLMSSSALRFAQGLTNVLKEKSKGNVIGADCYGPMTLEPTQPGLFWYGIHSVEMLFAVLGHSCVKVQAIANQDHDLVIGEWEDGRIGTVRGNRMGNRQFGAMIHFEQGSQWVDISADVKPYYASLLEKIMQMFTSRNPIIEIKETLQIIRFIEAANQSRQSRFPVVLS